jgi:hypothetical protein
MRKTVFHDLHVLYPLRIVNKTNGIRFGAGLSGESGVDATDRRRGRCAGAR